MKTLNLDTIEEIRRLYCRGWGISRINVELKIGNRALTKSICQNNSMRYFDVGYTPPKIDRIGLHRDEIIYLYHTEKKSISQIVDWMMEKYHIPTTFSGIFRIVKPKANNQSNYKQIVEYSRS